ncbi:MAG: sulfotransferase [Porticoccaceae bacterium]|nr:sulfotransferase [Porticoccaceae bacterium]
MSNSTSEASALDAIKQQLSAGKFNDAMPSIMELLRDNSQNIDAHYMAAVCYRYKKKYTEAQNHLDILKDLSLDKGRIYQEQGHLYKAQKAILPALTNYQTACQINPALIASWQAQLDLHTAIGNQANVRQISAQLSRLQSLPKVLIAVTDLTAQGKLFKAEGMCKKFLQNNPTNIEAMRLLAEIAMLLGALDDADFLLDSARQFSPKNAQVKIDYIKVLKRRQKFEETLSCSKQLLETDPENPQFLSIYAIAKMQVSDYQSAVSLFDKVLEKIPNDPVTLTSKGHALKTWGKNNEAIESYKAAILNNRRYCEAFYALSNLKTYQFDEVELNHMLSLEDEKSLMPADKTHLYFALGKAFEDKKDWQPAFNYYTKGNRIKKQQSSYNAENMSAELLDQTRYFSPQKMTQLKQQGHQDPAPIFILGLPRAGSTLLEQILSSHSMVDGTLELPNILTIAQQLKRTKLPNDKVSYPEIIDKLDPEELNKLGKRYIDETMIHRQSAPYFIDKMPNNFRHVGLIKSILPHAKIIDARRHPVACCFSGFKQLFAEGQEFSYDMHDIASYYNDYLTLMNHWDKALPNEILRVQYEDVIDDIETQVKRILNYCDLSFEENCIDFYKTKRAVRTASSEQVRQPINKKGVEQWRNFEEFLDPLQKQLAPSIKDFDLWRSQ